MGLPAITRSIATGINVNVTLIFSIQRYEEVLDAYLRGLEERLEAGHPIGKIASVASFFISRIDTNVDARLQEIAEQGGERAEVARTLLGKIAIANAKLAYSRHKDVFPGARWEQLAAAGGRVQRALWASTSIKNPAYPDSLYVDELIGPNTVNTVPPKTLDAFRDHGTAALTLEEDLETAQAQMEALASLVISMAEVTVELEAKGVRKFADAFTDLLDSVVQRI